MALAVTVLYCYIIDYMCKSVKYFSLYFNIYKFLLDSSYVKNVNAILL